MIKTITLLHRGLWEVTMHRTDGLITALIWRWEFWLCILATIPSVLALLIPSFPASLTIAFDVLLIVVLAFALHTDGERTNSSRGE
jgi:hypothetical protein